jgi:ribose-phosphate pyrophosphokinase
MSWDDRREMKVLAGRHHVDLANRVCEHMGVALGRARTAVFPDGELIVHVEENVRGRDCYVILSTCEPVNDNVMELLIFADSLRRASAARITAVIPYFGYGRQDRKERGREPITAKLIANLMC